MTDWLIVASEKIKKSTKCHTAKTDESRLLAVLAVPHLSKSQFFTDVTPSGPIPSLILLNNFFNQAQSLGINLLHEDTRWLRHICLGTPVPILRRLLDEYVKNWLNAMHNESITHKKENAGRHEANTKIREYIYKMANIKRFK